MCFKTTTIEGPLHFRRASKREKKTTHPLQRTRRAHTHARGSDISILLPTNSRSSSWCRSRQSVITAAHNPYGTRIRDRYRLRCPRFDGNTDGPAGDDPEPHDHRPQVRIPPTQDLTSTGLALPRRPRGRTCAVLCTWPSALGTGACKRTARGSGILRSNDTEGIGYVHGWGRRRTKGGGD